jgi:hypothetical protein
MNMNGIFCLEKQEGRRQMNTSSGLARLDAGVMLWCTQFAHWFQRLTGRTSFFIAKLGLGFCMWSLLADIVNYWLPILTHESSVMSVALQSMVMLSLLMQSVQCNKAEESLYGGKVILPAWVMSQRSRNGIVWRLFVFILTIVAFLMLLWEAYAHGSARFWMELIHTGFAPGMAIFAYFINVDPLPPGTSKVREWVESLGFGPKMVRVEN